MSLVTLDELKTHVGTPLDDDALTDVLLAAEATLEASCGVFVPGASGDPDPENVTETVFRPGTRILPLTQRVGVDGDGEPRIVSVTEYAWGDTTGSAVAATDYVVRPGGLDRGPYWWPYRTKVVYVPADSLALRRMAIVDLCKLALARRPGITSETVGDWAIAYAGVDYETTRDSILETVCSLRDFA